MLKRKETTIWIVACILAALIAMMPLTAFATDEDLDSIQDVAVATEEDELSDELSDDTKQEVFVELEASENEVSAEDTNNAVLDDVSDNEVYSQDASTEPLESTDIKIETTETGSADIDQTSSLESGTDTEPQSVDELITAAPKTSAVTAETVSSSHVAATSEKVSEKAGASFTAPKAGWNKVDGSWYFYNKAGDTKARTGWVVTATTPAGKTGSLQRYWLGADGVLATNRLVSKAESGYWAYAKSNGQVVRGRWVNSANSYVYLADNDGKLMNTGWNVTKAYDPSLQRFWIDKKAHAAIPGFSTEGYAHYTLENHGYVLREAQKTSGGLIVANNDGLVLNGNGWVVTNKIEGHLERYYITKNKDGVPVAKISHFTVDGNHYYGMPKKGYVLRGKMNYGTGKLLADNDGKLAWNKGWLVTRAYDSRLQRYYIHQIADNGAMGARLGLFKVGDKSYYGREDQGYVVRGAWISKNKKLYFGDNDGVLRTSISGNKELDKIIETIIVHKTGVGNDALYKGFLYVAGYKFKNMNTYPGNSWDWSVPYAIEFYKNGYGNCYRYAALMRWIAQGLGYNAGVYAGSEPYWDGRNVPHGWTTIKQNGKTYVIDCENQYEMPQYKWFMVTYKEAPVEYRTESGKALENLVQ